MKFSIVMPTFNSAATIIRALNGCKEQTNNDYEIIIVDDCSKDMTIRLINKYRNQNEKMRIQLIALRQNGGPAKARNAGWQIALGDYIAFLDSDDYWLPNKLQIISEIFEMKPMIGLLSHSYALDDKYADNVNEKINYELLRKISFWDMLMSNKGQTSCVVVKKSIALKFKESMRYVEDHELWLRILNTWESYYYNSPLAILGRPQLSHGGLSGNIARMRLGEIQMYFEIIKYKKAVLPALPLLIVFSLIKHCIKILCIIANMRRGQ